MSIRKKNQYRNNGWVLLKTQKGVFNVPQFFSSKRKAQAMYRELSKTANPDYDELTLFALSDCIWDNNA
jgi:hypothetical protein